MNENVGSKLRHSRFIGTIFFGFISIIFDIGTYRIINGLGTDSVIGFIFILVIMIFTNFLFIKN